MGNYGQPRVREYPKHLIRVIQGLYQRTRISINSGEGTTAPTTINRGV